MYKFLKTQKIAKTLVSKWGEVPVTCAEGMGGKGQRVTVKIEQTLLRAELVGES